MSRLAVIAGLMAFFSACSGDHPDKSAATADAVLAADRRFAELAAVEGAPYAFRQLLSDGAVILPATNDPVEGAEIGQWLHNLEDALEWTPEQAWGSASGDLGVSRGRWVTRGIDDDGNPRIRSGNYLTVWQRDGEGWKVVVDMRGDLDLAEE